MKIIVALIGISILICLHSMAFAFTTYTPPIEATQSTPQSISYPKITKLEEIFLNACYERDDINTRLTRLEQKVLKKTYPESDFSWRVENLMKKADSSAFYSIDSKELARIEKQILGRTYKKDPIEQRLSQLEQEIFGAMQGGQPDERFETIRTAASTYNNFAARTPFNNQFGTTTPTLKSRLESIFTNFAGTGSYMTGYTPPITSYGNGYPYGFSSTYNPMYQNSFSPYRAYNSGWNSAYRTPPRHHAYGIPCGCTNPYNNGGFGRPPQLNHGFYGQNPSIGAGAGVRILD